MRFRARVARKLRNLGPPAWLSGYGVADAKGDLTAGLTVGTLLIPQSMAYAVLAGMPPIYGLYASLVPLLVYPLLGTSRHLAVGVNAVSMVIVAAGVGALAEPESGRYVALVLLLTAMVGVFLLAMGALRLGFLADLLSRPVITGFTAAAGVIIIGSQLGALLGVDLARTDRLYLLVLQATRRLGAVEPGSVAVGVSGIVFLASLHRFAPRLPVELLWLVVATAGAWVLDPDGSWLRTVGAVPSGLPGPALPMVDPGAIGDLWATALTLALVHFLGLVSLARTFAARHRYTVNANRELLAIGAGNLLGSVFRGLPITASFSRTAVNERAGARSPLSNAAAAALVALVLLYLTPLFRHLPLSALAAILVVAGAGLVDLEELRLIFRAKRSEGWVAILTFVVTIGLGVQEGIFVGIVAAVVVVLYWISRPNIAELGLLPGTRSFRNLQNFAEALDVEGVLILRVDAGFSFFNAQFLKDYVLRRAAEEHLRAVILDGMSINYLDTTAVQALEEVLEALADRGIRIYFTGLTEDVRRVVARSGLGERIGENRFHVAPHQAVEELLQAWDRERGTRRLERYREETERRREEEGPAADSPYT